MANWKDEVLLEGDFYIPPKKRVLFKVTLIPRGIFYSPISSFRSQYEEKYVQISDVVGCHCNLSATRSDSNSAFVTVFAYPFRKKMFSGKKTRHRVTVTFEINICATLEENNKIALRWKKVINCLSRGIHIKPSDVETCEPPPWDHFLILVNPHSGPGRALQIFKNEVEPMLEEAAIPFKLVVTEYAGHARDLIQTLTLSEWGAVVIVSGDGLIYEVINGLMQREDWTHAIKKPIGCLPGGSGNALACSINYAAGEPVLLNPVLHSTFVLIKHRVVPMDLVLVQTPSKQFYSFLSVTWGIVADIDFESEKYRNLGEARFTLGALKRIVNLRAYAGKLSFLPVAEYTPKTAAAPKTLKKIRRFSLRSLSNSMGSSMDSLDSSRQSVTLTGTRCLGSTPPSRDKMRSVSMPASFCTNGGSYGGSGFGGGDATFVIKEQSGSETDSPARTAGNATQNHCSQGEGDCDGIMDGVDGDDDVIDPPVQWDVSSSPTTTPSAATTAAVVNITSSTEINCNFITQNAHQAHSSSLTNGTGSGVSGGVDGSGGGGGREENSSSHNNTTMKSSSSKLNDFEEETIYANKQDGVAVPTPFLPPLDEPVPEDWVVIDGRFILVCGIYQTHLGSDMLAAPSARLSDGIIHLMFVRDGISRNQLFQLFLTFSEGTHVDSPDVEFVPVLAFRLEPDVNGGNIMIDGERLDPVPVQAQVLPGLSRVMAIQ